jgi:hypothetical protein
MKKTVTFLFFLFFLSCGYHEDKLKIKNNSEKPISYWPMLKNKDSGFFYGVGITREIEPGKDESPSLIGSIAYRMQEDKSDKVLYVIFFNEIDRQFVYKNSKDIVLDKKFKVLRYSFKELDSLNWHIEYNAK